MSHSLSSQHGNLKDIRFPRILATLERDRFTGVIQVTTPADQTGPDGHPATITREVHLSDGHIAWAISTEKQESLRAFLESGRTITDSQWHAAEERAREGSLREALTGLGLVSASELSEIEARRARAIVWELFSVPEGSYRVRERQLSPGTPDLEIAVQPVILKGVAERADHDLALEEVGSLDAVFSMRKEAIQDADLPGEYRSIAGQLDGTRSIGRLCSERGLPDNFVMSMVAGLSLAGLLERESAEAASGVRAEPAEPTRPEERAIADVPPPPISSPASDPEEVVPEEPEDEDEAVLEAIEVVEEADEPEELEEEPLVAAGAESEDEPENAEILEEDLFDPGEAEEVPDEIVDTIREIPESVYGDAGNDASTRRWLLVGGAAAVGFAALLLILAAQNRGDAGELTTLASAPPEAVSDRPAGEIVPAAVEDEYPEEDDSEPPEPVAPPPPRREKAPEAVAGDTGSPILSRESRQAASSPSSRASTDASTRTGDFTIKILTACKEGTVERAIAKAGNARELFALPADIGGRSCQRLYWGGYATREQAQRALRRDVPAFFRNDPNPPAIVTMP